MTLQSLYSKISNDIGWTTEVPPPIPNPLTAQIIIEHARLGDEGAFRNLFRLMRFARPVTDVQKTIMLDVAMNFYKIRGSFMTRAT